jgi:protein-S-isoprenylcysteine O-methyltransferase Ste14
MRDTRDNANVRFPPPLIYLGALLLGIFIGRAVIVPSFATQPHLRVLVGSAVILIGVIVNFAGAGLFMRHRTAIIPHKPASRLVTTGVYQWTRNPMYLGMALLYCGLAILFDSIVALLLLPFVLLIIQTQVIAKEEAYLERAFGEEYRSYKSRVRRWI